MLPVPSGDADMRPNCGQIRNAYQPAWHGYPLPRVVAICRSSSSSQVSDLEAAVQKKDPMSMTLTTHENGDVIIVEASGSLMLGEAPGTLCRKVLELMERGFRRIVLNMAQVSCIDSSGIGALIASRRVINGSGGQLKLSDLGSRVQRLLRLTGLQNAFETFRDEESALDSFHVAAPAAAGTCPSISGMPSPDTAGPRIAQGQRKPEVL